MKRTVCSLNLFRHLRFRRRNGGGRRRRVNTCEALEDRTLLANIAVTDVYLTNGSGDRIDSPLYGTLVHVQTEFTTTDLPIGASYTFDHTIDGVTLSNTVNWGAGQSGNHSFTHRWGGWPILPDSLTATVTVDSSGTVSESNLNDNSLTANLIPQAPPI
ncbi:MAG: hypothetical protein ABGZ23_15515 [Fuerstiella sp.]|nr:hypothetical protein [Fuerstiella sp.]